jgi:RNA polymerase sigma-70 factor, ECF subfamily
MTSEDTLTRVRRMDMVALAKVHDRYYPDVYRYVRYRLGDELITEDISSEVFMRLLDALHKRGGPSKDVRSWLIGTASNLVNDHLRRKYSRRTETIRDDDRFTTPGNLEESYELSDTHQQLQLAILKLTPEQQQVLALRFAGEYSLEQTAVEMNKTINAVKALQFRAVEALKRLLVEAA